MRYIIVIGLIALLILGGCSAKEAEKTTGVAVLGPTIKIGFIAPLTGPVPTCGRNIQMGLEMAKSLSDTSNLQFIIEDDQFDPKKSISAAQKMIQQDGVHIIIGPCSSSSTLAVAPLAESSHTVLFTSASMADDISKAGDYVFRLAPTTADQISPVVNLLNKIKAQNIGVIYLNNDAGSSFLKNIRAALGDRIIAAEPAEPPQMDFQTTLLKLKRAGVQTIFLATESLHAGTIVKQARELGQNHTFVGVGISARRELFDIPGNITEILYIVTPIDFSASFQEGNPEAKRFTQEYSRKYPGQLIGQEQVQTYIVIQIVAEAVKKCGDDANCVKSFLYSVKDRQTVMGPISADANGDMKVTRFVVKKAEGDKLVEMQE